MAPSGIRVLSEDLIRFGMLSRILDRPVVDMTALKGTYQLTLNLSMQDMHTMVEAAG